MPPLVLWSPQHEQQQEHQQEHQQEQHQHQHQHQHQRGSLWAKQLLLLVEGTWLLMLLGQQLALAGLLEQLRVCLSVHLKKSQSAW